MGSIWGGLYALVVQLVEIGHGVNLPLITLDFMLMFDLGAPVGLFTGVIMAIARKRKVGAASRPEVNWWRAIFGGTIGCLIGAHDRAPIEFNMQIESIIYTGVLFALLALLPVMDWYLHRFLEIFPLRCMAVIMLAGVGIIGLASAAHPI